MKYIREIVVEGVHRESIVLISPPDANGRYLVVHIGYRPSGPGVWFSDFGFVAAEVEGLEVGQVLRVKQLDYSEDKQGFWREIGTVKSNRRYTP